MEKSKDRVCIEQSMRLAGCALCNIGRPALIILDLENSMMLGLAGQCDKLDMDAFSTDFRILMGLLQNWDSMTESDTQVLLQLTSSLAARKKAEQEEAAHG